MGKRRPIRIALLVMGPILAAALGLASEPFDPNEGGSLSYGPKEDRDERKGTAVGFEAGEGSPSAVDQPHEPNIGSPRTYPNASMEEPPGKPGEPIIFDTGELPYPSRDKDPADAPPPKEPVKSAPKTEPDKADAPDPGICPLVEGEARERYRNHFRKVHSTVFLRWTLGRPFSVIYTKDGSWRSPRLVGGGFILLETRWNDAKKEWSARLFIPVGYICPSGEYWVRVHDAITTDASVIEIGQGVILLYYQGQPAYLAMAGAPSFEWRLVWDSGIEVEFEAKKKESKDKGKDKDGKDPKSKIDKAKNQGGKGKTPPKPKPGGK